MKFVVILIEIAIVVLFVLMLRAIETGFQMGPFPSVHPAAIVFAIIIGLLMTALYFIKKANPGIDIRKITWRMVKGIIAIFIIFFAVSAIYFFGPVENLKEAEDIQRQICTDGRLNECS